MYKVPLFWLSNLNAWRGWVVTAPKLTERHFIFSGVFIKLKIHLSHCTWERWNNYAKKWGRRNYWSFISSHATHSICPSNSQEGSVLLKQGNSAGPCGSVCRGSEDLIDSENNLWRILTQKMKRAHSTGTELPLVQLMPLMFYDSF